MKLRYAGVCRVCDAELPARVEAIYERSTKTVRCLDCSPADVAAPTSSMVEVRAQRASKPVDAPIDPGTPGASARREYERRQAKREARIREKHPKLGGLILAVTDEPQSTKAWDTGAVGEERLGQKLNELASDTAPRPPRPPHPRHPREHRPHRRHADRRLRHRPQALQRSSDAQGRGWPPPPAHREAARRWPGSHQARRRRPQAGRPRPRHRRRRRSCHRRPLLHRGRLAADRRRLHDPRSRGPLAEEALPASDGASDIPVRRHRSAPILG